MELDQQQNPIRCAFERANRMLHNVCFVIEPTLSFRLCHSFFGMATLKLDSRKSVIQIIVLIFNCNGEGIHCSRSISASVYLSSSRLYANDACSSRCKTEMIWTIKKVICHLLEETRKMRLFSVADKNRLAVNDIHRSDILSGYYTLRFSLSLSIIIVPRMRALGNQVRRVCMALARCFVSTFASLREREARRTSHLEVHRKEKRLVGRAVLLGWISR